jgi:hypothetical protein
MTVRSSQDRSQLRTCVVANRRSRGVWACPDDLFLTQTGAVLDLELVRSGLLADKQAL